MSLAAALCWVSPAMSQIVTVVIPDAPLYGPAQAVPLKSNNNAPGTPPIPIKIQASGAVSDQSFNVMVIDANGDAGPTVEILPGANWTTIPLAPGEKIIAWDRDQPNTDRQSPSARVQG
jgi:hypothetical protein